jgi:diadenylate cyclase
MQILIDTVSDLANQRIGALIVLEKKANVVDVLSGSIPLDGQRSESIVKSIFDPHSQGRDGAIVVVGDMVKRCACPLPLSADSGLLTCSRTYPAWPSRRDSNS